MTERTAMPNEFVVAINAGSSSLRFGVYRVGGEDHSVDAIVRARRICRSARWLGIEIDAEANAAERTSLATPSSSVGVYVIPTDEEQVIAGHTVATAVVSCGSRS